uniref:EF-hand domain-containing protein n=1 Tax=Oryza nivara TaxID=4536 RepID=A0A0E0IV08_ORYNI
MAIDATQWLLLLVVFLVAFLFTLLAKHGAVKRKHGVRVPPGPLAVPVLGSLVWLTHSSSANLEPLLRRLIARHGPVVSLRVGSRLSIFVADRRVAHAALVGCGAALADRPPDVTHSLLGESRNTITRSGYGPVWRLLRRNLVVETTHPSRVRLFAPARSWVRRVLVDKLADAGAHPASPPRVLEVFRYAMFSLLVLMCFGERLDEAAVRAIGAAQHDFLLYLGRKTSVFMFYPAITKHLFRGRVHLGLAVRRRQKELFMPLINSRRERKKQIQQSGDPAASSEKKDDNTTFNHSYVDTLLTIRLQDVDGDGDRALTDDEMVSLCSEFLSAGTDTTATALQWIMAELVKNPSIQSKLHDEIKSKTSDGDDHDEITEDDARNNLPYLKAVILEGLRKHPPMHLLLPHKAAEDIEVGGYLIPKGATVNFMVAEMGRDEREWEKPMEFIPERFLAGGDGEGVDVTGSREVRMMPFGIGRRICAGLGVAMLHLEYFVANLVKEFEWKEVAGDEVDLTEKNEFTTVMAKPLRAQLVKRAYDGKGGGRGGGCRVPPGPLAVPVLGNLLWLWHSPADLEPLLRRLIARHGPVVSLRVGSRLSIFVADRRRGAALADRPEVTRALLGENGNTITRASYGPTWRLLRRGLVSGTLHPSTTRARVFAPARSWARRVLVGKLAAASGQAPHGVMDTLQYAMFCLLVVMCFGERLDEADVRAIATAQHDWIVYFATKMRVFAFCSTITKHLFRGRIKMALALRRRQKELFVPLINARRERKTRTQPTLPENGTTFEHSYVDTLLDLRLPEDGNRALTDKEMVSLCSEFLDAGTDTMSTALQWIMAELVKNPSIQSKLYEEIKATVSDDHDEITEEDTKKMPYLKAVILEGLRKHPLGHFVLAHKAAEDIEVGGYLIPKGATVNFMVAEMGRDEREWENPMQFMPERFLPGGDGEGVDMTGSKRIRMMPFGVGRRMCAGLNTAMLHLEYFVANMVRAFEWKEVAGDEVDFAEKAELTTVMAKPLRAQLRKRPATVPENDTTFEHSTATALSPTKRWYAYALSSLYSGADTMSTTLQWIMAELVKNPSIQAKLYDEIKVTVGDDHEGVSEEDTQKMPYLKAVILEGLRKHPPGHFALPHKAAEDMDVGGYLIPKGATVNLMVAEMGRDEREWENPMQFIPERFFAGGDGEGVDITGSKRIRMMPFGVGRRMCAGINTAMLHLEYFVANMVREFEWKAVAGDEVDFAEKFEFTTVMAKPLRAQLWLMLLLAFLVALFILLSLRGGGERKCGGRGRVPPGPLAVPVLGNLLWLSHSSADLEPLLRRLVARYGPVVSLRVGSHLSIFVADRRVAHAALVARGAALADRPEVTRALLGENGNTITRGNYGPTWRLLRRNLVAETLHPSRARAAFAPARSWARRALVDGLVGGGAVLADAFRHAMFCLLVLMCFGEWLDEAAVRAIGDAQHGWLLHYATKMKVFAFCPAVTKHIFRGRIQTSLALRRRQKELFMPLISARRERKNQLVERAVPEKETTTFEHSYADTLLDIKLPEDGGDRALTDDEMVRLCSEFLDAGTDTMSTTLQWIMAELVKNPTIQSKLHDEIKSKTSDDHDEITEDDTHKMPYLKAVILEGLRKHPPGHFALPHKAAEDMEVGGYLIPKGATVNFMVAEMGRDEREWENPMQFMPERFLPGGDGEGVDVTGSKGIRMMPFGVGRRICAGLNTAMLHLEYFVANMVWEFEWREIAGEEVDFAEKLEFTTVMAKPLRAQLVRRRMN